MTRVLTEEQRKRQSEQEKERRRRRKERGECTRCKRPAVKGRLCEYHYDYDTKYLADYFPKWYAEFRDTVLSGFGGKCLRCGSTENLHIHHKKFNGKQHRDELGGSYQALKDFVDRGFPEDEAELLCNCCHVEVHREHQAKQHQMAQAAD